MLTKCRYVLKNTMFLELTMAIPKKCYFDIYYDMVNQIIGSGQLQDGNLHKKMLKNGSNLAL